MADNRDRLRMIVGLFGVAPSVIAKAAGVSKCYISRLLSQADPFQGSPAFWRKVEENLSELVKLRSTAFFQVPVSDAPASDMQSAPGSGASSEPDRAAAG